MSVLSKLRSFIGRHRGKLFVGGLLITGSVLLTRYAQQKLKDWHDRDMREFLERTRKQQHFESTEKTCNETILSLSRTLFKTLDNVIDTQSIINELKSSSDNVNNIDLWNKLRLLLLTRIVCLIYMSVMLVVILRIQLNIVGAYLFKDPNSMTIHKQESYLSLCHNLFSSGVQNFAQLVEEQFKKILSKMELSKKMKLCDFEELFWTIRSLITICPANPVDKFKDYIMDNNIPNDDLQLNNMIQITVDLLESDEVKGLTTFCLERGFALAADELSGFYLANSDKTGERPANLKDFIPPGVVELPFAKVLPIMHAMLVEGTLPNKLMRQLIMNDRLKTLGANVYECLSETT